MQPIQPSDCHPDLEVERLLALAQFFASKRLEVVSLHAPHMGDDGWSLGCRSFSCWRNGLIEKANSGEWPWFKIINPSKKFVFGIGAVPIRFFRGLMSKPPERTLSYSAPELRQLTLAFGDEVIFYKDLRWRFAIETDFLGEPTAVIFAGLGREDGAVVCQWNLPFSDDIFSKEPEAPRTNDIVELPAPIVFAPAVRKGAANDAI